MRVVGYVTDAAIICPDCAERDGLKDLPAVFSDSETDSPTHCDNMHACADAIELPRGRKVGALIRESLTRDGYAYVRDQIRQQHSTGEDTTIVDLWAEAFGVEIP